MVSDPVVTELKVSRIGNSRGVRLPAKSLARYGIGAVVRMEEHPEGILLRPIASGATKLSWRQTAKAMAADREDWSEWDAAAADGLGDLPWASESGEPLHRGRSTLSKARRPLPRQRG